MKRRLGLVVLAASLTCGAAPAAAYTALYSFGDSLSDVGNVYAASTLAFEAGRIPSPYPVSPPYYYGRFSNGPNWVDDLSAQLGLGPVLPSAARGNDFAVGGAQTGPTSVNPGVPLVDLNDQVQEFEVVNPSPASGALYTLDIGANDIGNAMSAYASGALSDPTAAVARAASNAIDAVDTLYADGARYLLYYEVPDLSLVPAFASGSALGGELAAQFNDAVLAGIEPLEAAGLTVFNVPVFTALQSIVSDPGRFGFANVTGPCLSGNYASPGTECADPSQYLFWDSEHPTAAAQALTADLAYATLTDAPDPTAAPEASTWVLMLIGFSGLAFAGWRAQSAKAGAAAGASM